MLSEVVLVEFPENSDLLPLFFTVASVFVVLVLPSLTFSCSTSMSLPVIQARSAAPAAQTRNRTAAQEIRVFRFTANLHPSMMVDNRYRRMGRIIHPQQNLSVHLLESLPRPPERNLCGSGPIEITGRNLCRQFQRAGLRDVGQT